MKQVTITVAALSIFALTSCQKELDWTCECQTDTTPITFYIEKKTKKNAKQECDSREVGIARDCKLR